MITIQNNSEDCDTDRRHQTIIGKGEFRLSDKGLHKQRNAMEKQDMILYADQPSGCPSTKGVP